MIQTITIPSYYNMTQENFNNIKTLNNVTIICQCCSKEFTTNKKNILKSFKEREKVVSYCSAKCSNTARSKDSRKDVSCTNCNKTFSKTLSAIKKSSNHFCNKSCAASTNNKIHIKRELTRTCVQCNETVFTYRHTRCQKHHEEFKQNQYINKTIGEYRNKLSVKGKHQSWINSHIRLFAKSWNKDLTKLPCAKCNYTKHVELAHIKGISTYNDETLLSVVNNKSNIIQLCPNCHWEFDNETREDFKPILKQLNKIYSDV